MTYLSVSSRRWRVGRGLDVEENKLVDLVVQGRDCPDGSTRRVYSEVALGVTSRD